jgi:hypothetical protein
MIDRLAVNLLQERAFYSACMDGFGCSLGEVHGIASKRDVFLLSLTASQFIH